MLGPYHQRRGSKNSIVGNCPPAPRLKRRLSTTSVEDPEPTAQATGLLGAITRIRTFEALKFPNFRLLWYGQATTSLCQWMDQVARGWLMYQLTNSPLELGLVSVARAAPLIFFSPLAGVLADQRGRKAQLVISQVTNAAINIALGVLAVTNTVQPWHVYVTAVLAGIVGAFQLPARQATISEIVARPSIPNAIGLNSMVFNLSRSIGPALAGIIIAASNIGVCYLIQAVIYGFATLWTIQMKVKDLSTLATGEPKRSLSAGMGDGFRYIRANPLVGTVMLIVLIPSMLGQPYTSMLPIFARDILQVGASGQGLLLTGVGVGALLGSVVVATAGNTGKQGLLMLGGAAVFGLALVGFALSPWFGFSLALMAVSGLCNTSYGTQANSLLQIHTPAEMRGRVMGVYYIQRGLTPFGSLFAGALASVVGAQHTVLFMGGTCAL
ncbi:MAG TPA: MFS transporter, partial [Chloroflexota bacterium]